MLSVAPVVPSVTLKIVPHPFPPQPEPPPSYVVPYNAPPDATRPPLGAAPSEPPVKTCNVVSEPEGVRLKTVPQPPLHALPPPATWVVPYKTPPCAINGPFGTAPSLPSVNTCTRLSA